MILDNIVYLLKTDKKTRLADRAEYGELFRRYFDTYRDEMDAYEKMTVHVPCGEYTGRETACQVFVENPKTGQIQERHDCQNFQANRCRATYTCCPMRSYINQWCLARQQREVYDKMLANFYANKLKSRREK